MIVSVLLLLIGLVILYYGAEYLVQGASSIALALGMAPLIVGLTVVAFGTSMPELVVSLLASLDGVSDIAIGNVVGSNIANIALIIGVSAVITPMVVDRGILVRDYWWMLLFSFGLWALAYFDPSRPAQISRIDATVILVPFGFYLYVCIRAALRYRKEVGTQAVEVSDEVAQAMANPVPAWKSMLFIVGGIVGLVVGAKLMVDNAIVIARHFDIPDSVIGVTIVAIGTSLPELATSVVAALKKEADISLGNIIGSNIFNIGLILGVVGLIKPMTIAPSALAFDFVAMMIVAAMVGPMMFFGRKIGRLSGAVLLLSYVSYLVMTYFRVVREATQSVSAAL